MAACLLTTTADDADAAGCDSCRNKGIAHRLGTLFGQSEIGLCAARIVGVRFNMHVRTRAGSRSDLADLRLHCRFEHGLPRGERVVAQGDWSGQRRGFRQRLCAAGREQRCFLARELGFARLCIGKLACLCRLFFCSVRLRRCLLRLCTCSVRLGTQAIGFLRLCQALDALLFELEPRLLCIAPAGGDQDLIVLAIEQLQRALALDRLRGGVGNINAAFGQVDEMLMFLASRRRQQCERLFGQRDFRRCERTEDAIVAQLIQTAAQTVVVEIVLGLCDSGKTKQQQGQRRKAKFRATQLFLISEWQIPLPDNHRWLPPCSGSIDRSLRNCAFSLASASTFSRALPSRARASARSAAAWVSSASGAAWP